MDIIASLLILNGSLLIALNNKWSKFAFFSYFLGNCLWIYVGYNTGLKGLLIDGSCGIILNIVAIRNWWFRNDK